MNLEFVSGLALVVVTVVTLAYFIKEFLGSRVGSIKSVRDNMSQAADKYLGSEPKPVNDHLIGQIATVTAHSDDSARPLTIRVNLELWPARQESTASDRTPIGAAVTVTKVDGPVLVVEASDSERRAQS